MFAGGKDRTLQGAWLTSAQPLCTVPRHLQSPSPLHLSVFWHFLSTSTPAILDFVCLLLPRNDLHLYSHSKSDDMNLNFSELAENVGFTRSHFYFRKGIEGLSWWSRGEDFRLPPQGAPVQSLVRELRSRKSKGAAGKKKKEREREKRKEKELMPRKPQ